MSDIKIDWDPGAFKKVLIQDLTKNGEIVGEFVESDARRRLLAISDPAWGRGYREGVVSRLLTNQVEAKNNEVKITVGVEKSKSGSHHGFYIELGSSTAPAHPFLRPAVFQNAKEIISLLEGK
jgi:HK97 gp10 family phage protein